MKILLNKTRLPGFNKRTIINLAACLAVILPAVCITVPVAVHADAPPWTDNLDVTRLTDKSSRELLKIAMTGRPPEVTARSEAAVVRVTAEAYSGLNNVPAFRWSYGCSPTSASMMFGYYDRIGYPDMYTGPANGGICPMTNAVWGGTYSEAECPISASHQGIDGRTTKGHVDDYWAGYGGGGDPYLGQWAEHAPDSAADFMGSNQSKYGNSDGSTSFYINPTGDPLYDPPYGDDGCHGMRLFAESRGYTVVTNYTQYIKGKGSNSNKGFTFADYCAEIDAGRPVMIHVQSHTMMGYGYDTAGSLIYLHDTWDYNDHTMAWGGSYPYYNQQLAHWGVSVIQLAASPLTSTGVYGRVGVGTESPQTILHVTGTGPGTVPLFQRGTDSAGFIIERTPSNRWVFGVNENETLGRGFVLSTFPDGSGSSVPRLTIDPSGNVTIPGTLSKGAGSFRIDHPLNPADQYLLHSFVESPDMLNIYSGNVILDDNGEATLALPAYFGALNRDFTYQLDSMGGFAPLYVSQEIKDNRFSIAGGRPGIKVSWQVTGIRQDPFATAHPVTVEQDKPVGEKGFYMHPVEWGK